MFNTRAAKSLFISSVICATLSFVLLGKYIFAENPAITVSPNIYSNENIYAFTLTEPIVGATRYQYRTGGDGEEEWFDFSPALSNTVTLPNSNHPGAQYQEGENWFYFRGLDANQNFISGSNLSVRYLYGASAPTPPEGLNITPSTNTLNNFVANWNIPGLFFGDASRLKYYYSINSLPTPSNTTETSNLEVGPLPFAKQTGENIFYVVAKDEAGNIDYTQYAQFIFVANTVAPGTPTNLVISDISDKENEQYRIALGWAPPDIVDTPNFAGYKVYSSTSDTGPFIYVATTMETAYVHTGLIKDTRYYYYITATDKTNNSSVPSAVVDKYATGRYTSPPKVTKDPDVTTMSKKATISWVTARVASSTVEYGKTTTLGTSVGNSMSDYVTDHIVNIANLESNTIYYYKVVFIDPDGNIGQTEVKTFVTAFPPVVSDLQITEIRTDSILVAWETNTASYGEVRFGTSQSYGESLKEDEVFTQKHFLKLEGLKDGTAYNVQSVQIDEEGNTFYSDDYRIETLAFPRISKPTIQNHKDVVTPTVSVEYETNVETTTLIQYSTGNNKKSYVDITYAKEHKVEIPDLLPLSEYTFEFTGQDKLGNKAVGEKLVVTTLSDSLPPIIQKVENKVKTIGVGNSAESQLSVSVATNEPSHVIIEAKRGIGESEFTIFSSPDSLVLTHNVVINLGQPGFPYTFRVRAIDDAGNESVSGIKTIIIPKPSSTALDFVLDSLTRNFGWLGKLFQ